MRLSCLRLSPLPPSIRAILRHRRAALQPQSSSLVPEGTSTSLEAGPEDVTVNAWIKSVRGHKNVAFLELNDGSTAESLQGIIKGKGKAEGLTAGSSLKASGKLIKSRGPGQDVELVIHEVKVLGTCNPDVYPIQKKSLPAFVLRENAHLRFRTTQSAAMMRIRDALARDWHDWFEENEFIHVHTPILTGSDCEGAGEVFTLKDHPPPSSADAPQPFFPHAVHLTVSSQLHLEAPTHSLSRAYTLSPSFRAEPSLTSRHLSEFYMLEAELAWEERLDGLLDVVESGVRSVIEKIQNKEGRGERVRKDLAAIARTIAESEEQTSSTMERNQDPLSHLSQISSKPFTRITYTSALSLLASLHSSSPETVSPAPKWGEGISTEHEKHLAEHFQGPLFVTRYPKTLKPFYMLPTPPELMEQEVGDQYQQKGETVECFDLLFPAWGEMAGGSLREHRLPNLLSAIEQQKMKKEDYEWYLDLRRFGTVPHGGWGMGWDRWIGWMTGLGNIRDVVPFPRWKGHCKY